MNRSFRFDPKQLLWCVPLASSLVACSSQVQSDYPGEPIATLRGKVTAQKASLESDVSAAIVWSQIRPEFFGERVDVQGSFPASFTLNLFEPPPAEAEVRTMGGDYCIGEDRRAGWVEAGARCDGRRIPEGTGMGFWLGHIVAVDSSVEDGELDGPDVVGADPEHIIVYFDHDDPGEDDVIPANASAEQAAQAIKLLDPDYLGPRNTGYHLGKLNPKYRAQRQERWECRWQGLCAHWTIDPDQQGQADWDFERCVAKYPDNPTCEALGPNDDGSLREDETAENVACREQAQSRDKDCSGLVSAAAMIENPDDLEDAITIELGLTFWDAADWNTPY